MKAIYSVPETGTGDDGVLKKFVAANLSFYMQERGLDRRSFADKVGVKEPAISKWLSGLQLPRDQYWPKILEVLQVDMEDVAADPNKRSPRRPRLTLPERDRDVIVSHYRSQLRDLGYDVIKIIDA